MHDSNGILNGLFIVWILVQRGELVAEDDEARCEEEVT
jgi:hypothetical protein